MKILKIHRPIAALFLPLLLFAVGCDDGGGAVAGITPSEVAEDVFTIQSTSIRLTASPATIEGTFEASGAIVDHGTVQEVVSSAEPLHRLPSLYGTKTLVGEKGTIKIEFYVGLSRTDHDTLLATGGFQIIEGSGAYADLQGDGNIDVEVALNATATELTDLLEGKARYIR